MSSDIILEDNDVIVKDAQFMVHGTAISLDSAERRGTNQGGNRRALVHSEADGLTINFGGEYPGGVRVESSLNVQGTLQAPSLITENLTITLPPKGAPSAEPARNPEDGGFVIGHPEIAHPVLGPGVGGHEPIANILVQQDHWFESLDDKRGSRELVKEILKLRALILSLHTRVKKLEGR